MSRTNRTSCEDAYLWGDSILVAPVLEAGAAQRATYLPHGVWWDYWNGVRVEGGRDVTREVDLGTLPLYVKAGSILPVGPIKQHTQEESGEPLKFRVYPGADGFFSLYEDDGTSFHYEQGEFTRIACAWDDMKRTLTLLADPKGQLPHDRVFKVEIVGQTASKQVKLSGGAVSVRF